MIDTVIRENFFTKKFEMINMLPKGIESSDLR